MTRTAPPETANRASVSSTALMAVNRVLMTRIMLSTISTPMMVKSTTFCHVRFTQGPRMSLSLHSKTRNNMAEGSRMPASTWTHWVSVPSRVLPASSTASDAAVICPA
jgi:hypothetical protein